MACQPMYMWTLSALIAAFLDLAIAYLLLCISFVAFLASKFLGFFGLNLPCPCNGLFFIIPSKDYCLNRLLVDVPTQKVSYVQFSVKHSFPFNDSVYGRSHNYSIGGSNYVNGVLQIEGEESCSSVSDTRVLRNVDRREEFDVKGKEVINHRPRSRLRQRRKWVVDRGDYSSDSSYDPSVPEDFDPHHLEYDLRSPTVVEISPRSVTNVHTDDNPEEHMHMEKNDISIDELQYDNLSGDEKTELNDLERALQEEQTARAALYTELEKERSAAASAADEAMAMILRLQEEKAFIAMEARQYQRIIEEKSAYDAEEMKILKEILVRRETEKHFLEKELEAYKQMVSLGIEELTDEDPVSMLHQLMETTDKNVMIEDRFSETSFENESSIQLQSEKNSFLNSDEQSTETSLSTNVGNMGLQEKEMISADNIYSTSSSPQETKFLEEKIIIACDENETVDSNYDTKHKFIDEDTELNRSPHVYDVHVIGERTKLRSKSEQQLSGSSSSYICERSNSDMSSDLPPMAPKGKSSITDPHRISSIIEADSEMQKIDCEVGRLRERLKIVQQGRDRLSNLSVESKEREDMQLKLLEGIERQVQEIQDLGEPGKASRQISLPLPTSKGLSKKRRCRSVSSGLQRS